MSANIDKMFYYGETPWHQGGTRLNKPATAKEAIKAAGMSWEVEPIEVFARRGKQVIEMPDQRAMYRVDTKAILGIVSNKFRPIQNWEAFTFFDHVVGKDQAIYHTAGSLGIGERVWILAKLPREIRVAKNDVVEQYLLLANSHDGSSALRMLFTPIRVVCQNTLNAASLKGEGQGITIWHTGDVVNKVSEAQRALGLAVKYYDEFTLVATALVRKQVKPAELEKLWTRIIPDRSRKGKPWKKPAIVRKELTRLFEEGKGNALPGVRGTAWAALNAVTEYVDYTSGLRRPRVQASGSGRIKRIMFGSGARLKGQAFQQIAALVN